MTMRMTVLGLACMAAALGGCATWPPANQAAVPVGGSPSTLPPNAFSPEPNHYFGSGGP